MNLISAREARKDRKKEKNMEKKDASSDKL